MASKSKIPKLVNQSQEDKKSNKSNSNDNSGVEKLAENIFPAEIWDMILSNLQNTNDLWSCSNTCKLFRKILSPIKPFWMMQGALPSLFQYLEPNSVFNSLLACHRWKDVILNFIDSDPVHKTKLLLTKVFRHLKSPTTREEHQEILQLLRTHPPALEAYFKNRQELLESLAERELQLKLERQRLIERIRKRMKRGQRRMASGVFDDTSSSESEDEED